MQEPGLGTAASCPDRQRSWMPRSGDSRDTETGVPSMQHTRFRLRVARWGALGLATMVALAMAMVFSPAQASPGNDRKNARQTYYKVVPYVVTDPELVAHPGRLTRELRRSQDLDRFGISPATRKDPNGSADVAAAADEPASYVTNSSRFPGGSKPEDMYDYATLEECDDNDDAYDSAGWIKNRYSYCQKHVFVMPAYECTIFPPRCRQVGEYMGQNTLIGYGKAGGWQFQGLPEWRFANFFLDVDVLRSTGVFNRPGSTMAVSIECDGNYPSPAEGVDEDNACVPGPEASTERPVKQWRHEDTAEFSLGSEAVEPSASHGEQIATGEFYIQSDFDIPWFIEFLDIESPPGGMRFDSAWYLPEEKQGSVFDRAVPGFSYSESDSAVAGVADHIDDARRDPDDTVPVQRGKVLHGATAGDPIHRLAPGKSAATNRRYRRNRSVVRSFCGSAQMPAKPPEGGPFDCDEYSFASTYEGAARYRYDGDDYRRHYSVRWVNSDVNQEAGRRLGRWYTNDRILDHEEFFVPITE
jgi:hypothetical protein